MTPVQSITAVLGDVSIPVNGEPNEVRIPGIGIGYPGYSDTADPPVGDIAVVRLQQPAVLNNDVQTIALASQFFKLDPFGSFSSAVSYGWGQTDSGERENM